MHGAAARRNAGGVRLIPASDAKRRRWVEIRMGAPLKQEEGAGRLFVFISWISRTCYKTSMGVGRP